MNAKPSIIRKLRNNLREKNGLEQRRKNARTRIDDRAQGVIPKFSNTDAGIIKKFIKQAESADATVVRVKLDTIAKEIPIFLRRHNLPMQVKCGNDTRLKPLIKEAKKLIEFSFGVNEGDDLTCLSLAECGIAETGTLGLISNKENPTANNFLPENHIVIVQQSDLVKHYENMWDRLRKKFGKRQMPRTVNLVTGPSRSGDIEQKLILGAHGPMRLHILLLDN